MRADRRTRRLLLVGPALATIAALAIAPTASTQAAFTAPTANPANTIASAPDWRPPITTALTVIKAEGGTPGYVRRNASYRLIAKIADDPSSQPPSGVGTVTGNAVSLTAGATAVALPATTTVVAGVTYTHQSAALTSSNTLANGTYSVSVSARDLATPVNVAGTFLANVVVDRTAPAASALTIVNGLVIGRPDTGDTLTFVWNEPIEAHTFLAGWAGTVTDVTVRITNAGGGGDTLAVRNAANTAALPFGTVALGDTDYVAATTDFGAPGAAVRSTMTWTSDRVVVRLGTPATTPATGTGNSTHVWTPTATITDRAGNPSATTAVTEPAPADRVF